MNERIAAPWIPSWIPASGHALRHAGIHFDAVRMKEPLAERVASELMRCTDFEAGPIVAEATGDRNMYFLLPPQTAASFQWPSGVRALTRSDRGLAYVGVPALTGMTWPLGWRSVPSAGTPFVAGELLWEVVELSRGGTRRS
ncbi:hypothetical protein [Streptomyces sp. WM6386]|uniref:hypothetical protein n=1 Tax=Streptomyces sp. WM6386 TaxID=1415558 RepID=UPI0006199564|nr:hypothetical protein [Streptomyces sp. WM6386]KKD07063.1 hypothetical protein TN53_15670 [Streptomyces sp. WM6386]